MTVCPDLVDDDVRRPVLTLAADPDPELDQGGSDGSPGSSVQKALAVLEAFKGAGSVLGVTEVARRGGLSKSTAHRMLALLLEQGYVERVGSRYALGGKLFELGNAAPWRATRTLRAVAMPYLVELLQATQATVHLTVPVDDELLLLEKVYGHQGARGLPAVGSRIAAADSAPGDVIRAFAAPSGERPAVSPLERQRLARVRQRGFASGDGGAGAPTMCLSAPVVPRSTGCAVAAVSVVLRRNQHRPASIVIDLVNCGTRLAGAL